MPILENQRWELFCQAIVKGEITSKAYELAGFRPSRSNSARLRARECIRGRILELTQACADGCQITIQSICDELDQAIAIARSKNQAQPLVNAAALRARLGGLMVEKQEIQIAERIEEPNCVEEVLARVAVEVDMGAAKALAAAFKLEWDEDAVLAVINGSGELQRSYNQQAIEEWHPPRSDQKRKI